ncbi:MAG: YggS family pyridoxal phosphate-dependent enzyme [Deltaproteobacteria bacterium]|nr:YggS family pyridoxal phosphate-dependent enzyme [Deltaproteobacteria bacterium]MBW2359920.1 YggS family pyridoxal phosphate-dependent enzyme [Deltaproteobacteria bacterium]
MSNEAIATRLAALRARIADAAARSGRSPETIRLVGVSKRQPLVRIAAAVRAGLDCIGENYVQEAQAKLPKLRTELERHGIDPPRCRFIGQLQRNKAGAAVELFDAIETLDRERLGASLERRAAAAGRTLEVLLQVDVSGEPGKGGCAPEALPSLLAASQQWPQLRVTGLMAIPAPADDPEQLRPAFSRLRELRDSLQSAPGGESLTELSMGMSADFEVAIEEGATSVRIGTALFGPRSISPHAEKE